MKYQRIPTIIEPEQFTDPGKPPRGVTLFRAGMRPELDGYPADALGFVTTIHGQRAAVVLNDWIMPEPNGERFYPCKPDVFAANYIPAPEFDATKIPSFEGKLTELINYFSMETMGRGGDTPDFILASFLVDVLGSYDRAMQDREKWYGRDASSKVTIPPTMKNHECSLL